MHRIAPSVHMHVIVPFTCSINHASRCDSAAHSALHKTFLFFKHTSSRHPPSTTSSCLMSSQTHVYNNNTIFHLNHRCHKQHFQIPLNSAGFTTSIEILKPHRSSLADQGRSLPSHRPLVIRLRIRYVHPETSHRSTGHGGHSNTSTTPRHRPGESSASYVQLRARVLAIVGSFTSFGTSHTPAEIPG